MTDKARLHTSATGDRMRQRDKEGIPIPKAQSPYYCVNCGMYHAPNPSVPASSSATAAEVAALSARISRLEAQFCDIATNAEKRVSALEAAVGGLGKPQSGWFKNGVYGEFDEVKRRLSALEAGAAQLRDAAKELGRMTMLEANRHDERITALEAARKDKER